MFKDIKNFFADFIKNIRRKHLLKFMPLIVIPCLIAILVPTIFAVWHVYFKKDTVIKEDHDNISITLYDAEGLIVASDKIVETKIKDSPFISIFNSINSGKEFIEAPENCSGEANYKLTINHGASFIEYSCYFTSDPASSYLKSNDRYYLVNDASYVKFLNSEYAEDAYAIAKSPILLTKEGTAILPTSVNWSYRAKDGELRKSKNIETAIKTQRFYVSGSISLSFATPPTDCLITATTGDGAVIYEGDLAGLSSLITQVGTQIRINISANWSSANSFVSFGSAEYSFDVVCKNHASFYINTTEAKPGEFIVLSVYDLDNSADIIYSPINDKVQDEENPDTANLQSSTFDHLSTVKPVFVQDGTEAFALLPIPYSTPSGNFTFSLSNGTASDTFTVKVLEAEETDVVTLTKSKKLINSFISKEALNEVYLRRSNLTLQKISPIFFRGEFASLEDTDLSKAYSYGDHFIIGEVLNENFAAYGNEYSATSASGANVYALNIGKVVYTGYLLSLGNVVIVDHGMGLFTWYCNLSTFDCAVGDVLAKGELLGKSGASNMLDANGVLLLCSIYDQFIDPDFIQGKEIIISKHSTGENNNDTQ